MLKPTKNVVHILTEIQFTMEATLLSSLEGVSIGNWSRHIASCDPSIWQANSWARLSTQVIPIGNSSRHIASCDPSIWQAKWWACTPKTVNTSCRSIHAQKLENCWKLKYQNWDDPGLQIYTKILENCLFIAVSTRGVTFVTDNFHQYLLFYRQSSLPRKVTYLGKRDEDTENDPKVSSFYFGSVWEFHNCNRVPFKI